MKKRLICLIFAATLMFSQTTMVGATTRKDQLKQEKAATESLLAQQQSKLDSLEEKKTAITAEINQLDTELVNLMVEIDILKGEIEDKEAQIVQTTEELAAAEADRDEQYEAMKKRIQYLYENGGNSAWAQLFLQADDIASLLNQAEYVQQLYDSDRESLENFKAVVMQVADLKEQLESEKAELQEMKKSLENQQASLQQQLEEKKATSNDYTNQIADAQNKASAYVQLIREQNAEIQKIELEEKRAAEEAARKAAEEQARKEAEKQAAASTSSSNNKKETTSSGSTGSGSSSNSSSSSSSSSSSGKNYNPASQSVASYACNFVGNPYVYGGTSLTNGADCSGFIKSVYAAYGVSLPHSSSAMASCGVGVSYSEAMPGDIICYSGHVAIYLGGGAIVHASNERDGIKISSNAAYRTIVAVRRVM